MDRNQTLLSILSLALFSATEEDSPPVNGDYGKSNGYYCIVA